MLEEVLLAVQGRQPVYLVAAYGGATAAINELIQSGHSPSLTEEFQSGDEDYAKMLDHYRREAKARPRLRLPSVDYYEVQKTLGGKGYAVLNDGLTDIENERLVGSRDLDEINYLVLTGLGRKSPTRRTRPRRSVSQPDAH